jgi:hypothetical protein
MLFQAFDALSSCDEIFVQTCLDQNFTQKGKGLLVRWKLCEMHVKTNIVGKRSGREKDSNICMWRANLISLHTYVSTEFLPRL